MKHLILAAALCLPLSAHAQEIGKITEIASGFNGPWSIGFLPGGDVLVTEKRGKLWRIGRDGTRSEITGLPASENKGQGGLFDVLPARDFATSGRIYLSYAKKGVGTAASMARLEGNRLVDLTEIFEMQSDSTGGRHFGGRLAEAADGKVFLTMGDRGDGPTAQDPARHNGTIVEIDPARGSAVWTKGHRNPQGLAFDGSGQLWAHEHGAKGGDEINRIGQGRNYGWPVISYGVHYSGAKIGEGTAKDGYEQPVFYWDPSIAPSGLAIHSGKGWPAMKGRFFVGSLKFDHIAVMAPGGVEQIGRIKTSETRRVRDVREGPKGGVWFLSEGNGALYRIAPPE
ncbi:PQQ-dependent sugar dehydrogenase [Lentibacter sp. XHP0401]|jgi:aldose sugar dehydrogenase|uniref:PQQ-dependent sugar dehydrogenase n=1 Tax=Lentibacter sp. XHP0401 TaxID=2984334 RepID=UPI0021E77BBA|nr:PQQ-dependent sugar dehydrogenase [Lentibacter sp. XHP0401]MCV2892372.1 PQQ-dependent sugar dehydrogenase [Lentibacter sp. XHP0401]